MHRKVVGLIRNMISNWRNYRLFLSVKLFARSVVSDSLQLHGLQHARCPCPSLSSGICSNLCLVSQWCHPTISSSVAPFSSYPQSFLASGFFPMSQFFASGSQNIRASASVSVRPVNIQGWFPLGLTGLISLQSKGLSRVFSSTTIQKHQFFNDKPYLWSNSHISTTGNYFVPLFPSHALTNGQKSWGSKRGVSKLTKLSHISVHWCFNCAAPPYRDPPGQTDYTPCVNWKVKCLVISINIYFHGETWRAFVWWTGIQQEGAD